MIQTVTYTGDTGALVTAIRSELRNVDPNLVLFRPQTFEGVLATVRAQDRFATTLMSAFGLLALV